MAGTVATKSSVPDAESPAPAPAHDRPPLAVEVVQGFERNQLMVFASAISFQLFTAIVPVLLFGFGLLGTLQLDEVWRDDVRPAFANEVSPAVLTIADDTVDQVFESKQLFWVTMGLAMAIWQVSGGVRASIDALNRIYDCPERRPRLARYVASSWLAAAVIALTLLAAADIVLLPVVLPEPGIVLRQLLFVARWGSAAGLLCLSVGLIVHQGPNRDQPIGWVSAGTLLIVVSWTLMCGGLLAYLTGIASYGSVFGNLATLVVVMGWTYASSVVFLAGVQIDAILRERHDGDLGAAFRREAPLP